MLQQDLNLTTSIRLFYDLHVPETAPRRAPLLIAAHGYGAHKGYMMREARSVAPEDFVIASIQAPHQHLRRVGDDYKVGFGWLTDYKPADSITLHHRFILDLVQRLASDDTIDPTNVFLMGFSQACALNFRFALTFPDALRGVIGICGAAPGDLGVSDLYKRSKADAFYLYNNDDEFYSLVKYESFAKRLGEYLPHLRSREYDAKHEIVEAMREDIREWLTEVR